MNIICAINIALLLFLLPSSIEAEELDSIPLELDTIESSKTIEAPKTLSKEEMNDLFGPEPYLGPTSWLESKKEK